MMLPISTTLSSTFRRVLLRPGNFSIAQRSPTRAISSYQFFATAIQRNFTTTTSARNSDSTADSKPELEAKPKSTRRRTASSPKTAGEDQEKGSKKPTKKEKPVEKPKVTINSSDLPPKFPGNVFSLWLRDWISTQPKIENREGAEITVKRGAQVWNELPEYEKEPFREKARVVLEEHQKRMEDWREKVDPAVLRELNRRRVASGKGRIRGPRRPLSGYNRFSAQVRNEYRKTAVGEDYRTQFKVAAGLASSQWKAMSDAEKAEYNDPAKAEFAAWREERA